MRHILASPYSCHSTFLPLHILATPLFLPCYILAMSLFCRANVCRAAFMPSCNLLVPLVYLTDDFHSVFGLSKEGDVQ
jgi:hypothetical protein